MIEQNKQMKIDTRIIHAGEPSPRIEGAVSMPVFQSSTFQLQDGANYHDLGYIRLNNTPNHAVLHAKLADIESAEAAIVTASGMAAITTTLLSLLSNGEHLLIQSCLYGGTHNFITEDLKSFGISYDFIDGDDPASWKSLLKPNTRVLYVETMSNPLLEVVDLKSVAEFANGHGLVSVIDNTFASPINFRPPEHGFDLSIHSGTKYLNGHSDIVAGAIVGRRELIKQVKQRLDHLGGCLDPHACFLLHRGLKTLALRVRQQNATALALAKMLENYSAVARVHYPGLESHPQHQRAATLFDGYGGVLSIEMKQGGPAAAKLIEAVNLPISAPSLGGVESLITRPVDTSHAGMTVDDRERLGITEALVRVSVGIESPEDLMADFSQALQKASGRK